MSVAILTRAAILETADREFADVEVPEWGGSVRVAMMSAAQRDAWEDYLRSSPAGEIPANTRAFLVVMTAVDEALNPLFTADDAEALGSKSADAVERVALAASKLNKIGKQEIADAEKNSSSAPRDASSSTSPAT